MHMKLLTFSTLYPHAARPTHGIFVETRLRQLVASGQVESKVVAPVPWFPFRHAAFGDYAVHARAPAEELGHGIEVLHPRYPLIPKVGMTVTPVLLAQAVKPAIRRLLDRYDFDAIDAHYLYPDGVAAVILGKHFRKPVVLTARGTDVTLIPRYRLPRAMILWAARRASALITVSRSLKDGLTRLGVPPERVTVLRNGVDLDHFRPTDRATSRARLGLGNTTLLSVGHLIERKAHHLAIEALAQLPDANLIVIGDGPERGALGALAQREGVEHRVRFLPAMSQEALREYYGAADALILASSREGWANVLLESMACGTPVIASNVGGASELVTAPAAGVLFEERTAEGLAAAIGRLFSAYPDRGATRRHAEQFGWSSTTRGQIELFRAVTPPRTDFGPARQGDDRVRRPGAK
jgi:glycosyltransferase involved in cell wall biosynthesis